MVGRSSGPFEGLTVLVVENEPLVGMDIQEALEGAGANVIGPVATVNGALTMTKNHRLDAAILDIKLDEPVFPVAKVLQDQDVPFVFCTGYGSGEIPAEFSKAPRCIKPVEATRVLNALEKIIGADGRGG